MTPAEREKFIETELREEDSEVLSELEKMLDDPASTAARIDSTIAGGMSHRIRKVESDESIDTVNYPKLGPFGDFQLIAELGRGGMGIVYKAEQKSLKRMVAIKMILPHGLTDEAAVGRFNAEAEAVAQLEHPGIVPIYEYGESDGRHFFTMPLIEGGSMSDLTHDGPMSPQEATEYLVKVAAAVQYAHERGIIHRDLKPANILIDMTGEPKVTDFGLAKLSQQDSNLTATGQILGTPSYMPPEQAAGQVDQITVQCDVYSMGAILYTLLTGRPPFQTDNPLDTLMQVQEAEPVSPRRFNSKIARDLETICLKCLQKRPADRYSTAEALKEDLSRFAAGAPIAGKRVSFPKKSGRWIWKHRRVVLLSLAPVLLTLGILFVWDFYRKSQMGALDIRCDTEDATASIKDGATGKTVMSVSLPTPEPLKLPAGHYKLDVVTPMGLPRVFDVHLPRKFNLPIDLKLEEAYLNSSIDLENRYEQWWQTVKADGGYDFLIAGDYRRHNPKGEQFRVDTIRRYSGRTGSLLWVNEAPSRSDRPYTLGYDVNGDGYDEIILCRRQGSVRCLNGRDGKTLWETQSLLFWLNELRQRKLDFWPSGGFVCQIMKWNDSLIVCAGGTLDAPALLSCLALGTGKTKWTTTIPATAPPVIANYQSVPSVVVVDKESAKIVNLEEGSIVADHKLDFRPTKWTQPIVTDMDDDKSSEILVHGATNSVGALFMVRLNDGSHPWNVQPETESTVVPDHTESGTAAAICTVATAPNGSRSLLFTRGLGYLEKFDMLKGESVWRQPLETKYNRIEVGPDIDSDGHADLFLSNTVHPRRSDGLPPLSGSAYSGSNGKPIWTSRIPGYSYSTRSAPEQNRVWSITGSSRPFFVAANGVSRGQSEMVFLNATNGQMVGKTSGVAPIEIIDVDGDGIVDLCATDHKRNRLRVLKGRPQPDWSLVTPLGQHVRTGDLDGDGIDDIFASRGDSVLLALSGANGRTIWKRKYRGVIHRFVTLEDIDNDGRCDLRLRVDNTSILTGSGNYGHDGFWDGQSINDETVILSGRTGAVADAVGGHPVDLEDAWQEFERKNRPPTNWEPKSSFKWNENTSLEWTKSQGPWWRGVDHNGIHEGAAVILIKRKVLVLAGQDSGVGGTYENSGFSAFVIDVETDRCRWRLDSIELPHLMSTSISDTAPRFWAGNACYSALPTDASGEFQSEHNQ